MVFRDEMGRFVSPEGVDTPEKETQKGYVPIDEVPDPNGKTPEDLLIEAEEEKQEENENGEDEEKNEGEDLEEETLYDLQQKGQMTSTGAFEGNTDEDEGEYNPVGSQEGESVHPHLSAIGVGLIKERKASKREESFPRVVRKEENVRQGRQLRKLDEESLLDGGEEYTEPTIGERDDIEMGNIQEENNWKKQLKEVEPRDPGSEYDTDEHAVPKQVPMRPRERMGAYPYEERAGDANAQSRPRQPTSLWKRMFGRFRRERKDTPKNSA